ncbi:ly6/PLAUR domain-containing protein 1-like [Saccostrea echinata]|uniref:ly6/PLAUR domain-containing protein 1-like n=1 Tax=Saccostrea echinata TaxID=191078 RepID=UPI002A8077AD|nr:ly6/PLAUR domain-containing protein 1-like [Saccostrea echinata]
MRNYIRTVLGIFYLIHFSGALYCYQCGDGKSNGVCQEDLEEMVKDNIKHSDITKNYTDADFKYRKNCSSSEDACMIERVEVNGVIVAYIRDCSDGMNYSINASRFWNLEEEKNSTTCSYVEGKFFACLSLCATDLCNGPQRASDASSSLKTVMSMWTTILLSVYFIAYKLFF